MCKKLTFLHGIKKLYSLVSVVYVLNLFTLNTKILLTATRHQFQEPCKNAKSISLILYLLLVLCK